MQVLYIYFSVMILRDVMNCVAEEIADLSDWCRGGRIIDFYLTSGAGTSDAHVSMIASEEHLNCTLIYKVKSKNFVMLVVEYPDKTPEDKVCFSQSNNTVLLKDYDEKHKCHEDGKHSMYFGSSQDSISVSISSRGLMNTVKLTSTSMRVTRNAMCYEPDEIKCVYKNEIYCMNSLVLCDDHINCGIEFDEAESKCREVRLTFIMIICTFLTGILSFVLIASAAYTVIPARKEIFIHAYDQSLSLFDCVEIVKSEIYFQELLPLDDELGNN